MALSDAAKKVQEALLARGIETPMTTASKMSSEERKEKIEFHMREILQSIDLDLTDDSLAETPARIAKMYVDEIFPDSITHSFPKYP